MRQQWEYFIAWYYRDDNASTIETLANGRGKHGWELVSACPRPGHPDVVWAFFKRPLEQEEQQEKQTINEQANCGN